MLDELERQLLERWKDLNLPGRAPRRLEFLTFHKASKKIRVLIFADGGAHPLLFAKTARFRTDSDMIRDEFERTRLALSMMPGTMPVVIPPVYACLEIAGRSVMVSRFVSGARLRPSVRNFLAHLRLVSGHIIALGTTTRCLIGSGSGLAEGNAHSLVETIRDGQARFLRNEPADAPRKDTLSHRFHEMLNAERLVRSLPCTVLQHSDWGLNNLIRVSAERFYLVDWEMSTELGIPLYDLLLFPLHYTFYYLRDWAAQYASSQDSTGIVKACFAAQGPFWPPIRNAVQEYCAALEISVEIWPVALLWVAVNTTNLCHQGLWADFEESDWREIAWSLIHMWDAGSLEWRVA